MPNGGSVNQIESSDLTTMSFGELSGLPSNLSKSVVMVPSYSVRVTRLVWCSQVTSLPCRSRVLPLALLEGCFVFRRPWICWVFKWRRGEGFPYGRRRQGSSYRKSARPTCHGPYEGRLMTDRSTQPIVLCWSFRCAELDLARAAESPLTRGRGSTMLFLLAFLP